MEEKLDTIETGTKWLQVVREFYTPFSEALKNANEKLKDLKKELVVQPVGRTCPECGEELLYRWGRNGKFISCSGFPKCKYSENLENTEPVIADEKCPKCGETMILREGKYGKFFGCKDYPKCKGILPYKMGFKCPEKNCTGDLVERRSKKGRVFYGCTNYPKCSFVSWNAPSKGPCPNCDTSTLLTKTSKSKGSFRYCHNCDWKESD